MILSYLRTVVLYLVLIFVIRLMGKRQIGQMEPSEFVVTMLVANLASIPMQDSGIPLLSGLVPILTVLGAELALSAGAMRSLVLRRLLCCIVAVLMKVAERIIQAALKHTVAIRTHPRRCPNDPMQPTPKAYRGHSLLCTAWAI